MSEWTFKYFNKEEFDCPDCGFNNIDYDFVAKLELMREKLGMPFKITSGCRCEKHNKDAGGKPDSAHLKGLAADIAVTGSRTRFTLIRLAYGFFLRIGVGRTFIHLDDDKALPQYVMWVY